jgi:hypothetical protein
MERAMGFLGTAFLIALLGCEEPLPPVIEGVAPQFSDSTTVPLGGTVDLKDGIRQYRGVQIRGTLTFYLNFFDVPADIHKGMAGGQVGVYINVQMEFQRINDYQGVTQRWHAGGKSYDLVPLQNDGTALLQKRYEMGDTVDKTYVNIEFLILRPVVRVHNLWISYEYPD